MFNWIKTLFINKSDDHEKSLRINSITIDSLSDSEWIRLIPIGDFPNHPNGAHTITREHIEQMAANFDSSGDELLYDYDHGSIFKADSRAAGWSPEVEVRDDGLYVKYPEFTNSAKKSIEDREYRFFSPVYFLNAEDKQGNKIGAKLHSVGLTNTPYMDVEIDHIGNTAATYDSVTETNESDKRTDMKLNKENLKKLGLEEDATEEQINAAIANSKIAQPEDPTDPKPKEKTKVEDDKTTANSQPNDELLAKVNSLEKKLSERESTEKNEKAEALVNSALSAGKILPRDKNAYLTFAKNDFEAAKSAIDELKANSAMPGSVNVSTDTKNSGSRGDEKVNSFNEAVDYLKPLVANTRKNHQAQA